MVLVCLLVLIVSISIILQVWSASKSNLDDAEQPTHELDVLRGHENDVNYVQFRYFSSDHGAFLKLCILLVRKQEKKNLKGCFFCSGCAVAPRSSTTETLREDSYPKFKNSWFVSHCVGPIVIALSSFYFYFGSG